MLPFWEGDNGVVEWLLGMETGDDRALTQAKGQVDRLEEGLCRLLDRVTAERLRELQEAERFLRRLEIEKVYRRGLTQGARFQKLLSGEVTP